MAEPFQIVLSHPTFVDQTSWSQCELTLEESPLYEYRRENGYQPVIGEGNPTARVMFVGEAPGKQEAASGRPFVGSAGRVLDRLLAVAGIGREDVYITNVVKDRPPARS